MTDLDLRYRTIYIYIYISVVEKMKIIFLNSLVYAAIHFMCTKGLQRSLQEGDFSLLSFNETRPNCHSDKIVCKLLRFAFTFFLRFSL